MRLIRTLAAACLVAAIAIPAAFAGGGTAPTAKAVGYAALLPVGTQGAVAATATGPRENGTSVGGLRPAGGASSAAGAEPSPNTPASGVRAPVSRSSTVDPSGAARAGLAGRRRRVFP